MPPSSSSSVTHSVHSDFGRPSSLALKLDSWWRRTFAIQRKISASLWTDWVRTPKDVSSPFTASVFSTCRTVTGTKGGCPGSPVSSITPNGAAANLASGGMLEVATFKGNAPALASGRPLSSLNPLGTTTVNALDSGSGG